MANSSTENSVLGITIGFVAGLLIVFGLEKLVGYIEDMPTNKFSLLAITEQEETTNYLHKGSIHHNFYIFIIHR